MYHHSPTLNAGGPMSRGGRAEEELASPCHTASALYLRCKLGNRVGYSPSTSASECCSHVTPAALCSSCCCAALTEGGGLWAGRCPGPFATGDCGDGLRLEPPPVAGVSTGGGAGGWRCWGIGVRCCCCCCCCLRCTSCSTSRASAAAPDRSAHSCMAL